MTRVISQAPPAGNIDARVAISPGVRLPIVLRTSTIKATGGILTWNNQASPSVMMVTRLFFARLLIASTTCDTPPLPEYSNTEKWPAHWLASGPRSTFVHSSGLGSIDSLLLELQEDGPMLSKALRR